MRQRGQRAYILIDFVVAGALTTILLALVGSVFVASLSLQRRGHQLREAQVHAASLVDLISRDVRGASLAPGVRIQPPFAIEEVQPVLAIARTPRAIGAWEWVLYVHDVARGEVRRLIAVQAPDGQANLEADRVVGRGVSRLHIVPQGNVVSIEAEVRRGKETARARTVAEPRNP